MKYDFKMEVDQTTSVGKIVAQIAPNSRVLEFGPGNGRMTSYLKEEKNCYVAIVELDQELYSHVLPMADDGFLGNIDEEGWVKHFSDQTFDYIVFADVLEHLMDPKTALAKVKPFLAETGEILITFPNLAHNSVLIDLFNNKLKWQETGLLDRTHKSFFLQDGFEKLFSELDLSIVKEDFTINQVGYNELASSYEDLPVELRSAFKARPFGEVYQYFYVLSKNAVAKSIRITPENSSQHKTVRFAFEIPEQEVQERTVEVSITEQPQTFDLLLPENITMVKCFPSLTGTIVDLEFSVEGQIIYPTATNAIANKGTHYIFSDSQVPVLELQQPDLGSKQLKVTINYEYEGQYSAREHELIELILEKRNSLMRPKKFRDFACSVKNKLSKWRLN